MRQRLFLKWCGLCWVLAGLAAATVPGAEGKKGVVVKETAGRVRVEIDGELFTEYHFEGVSRPFLYPIIGAGGAEMTRNWPMKEVEKEERDHPHHRSWWYAHGSVNGHDFWSEGKDAGQTVHDGFVKLESGGKGVIQSRNKLVAKDGTVVCTDERTITIHHGDKKTRHIDFEIVTKASHGEVTLGDTKEGTMAIRLNEGLRLKGAIGQGHIVNSEGVRDGETWGKRAKWCDYFGPLDGRTVGVAIFDHPGNPKHPTWWHVRDYGLFAANPFGVHDFEKQPAGTGNMVIPAGGSVTFRYRFYFHAGNEVEGKVAAAYEDYAQGR